MRRSPYRPVTPQGWHQIRGAVALAGAGFERITQRVQQMHERIADLSFRNLARAPVANAGSAVVRPVHDKITQGVYGAVRGIGGAAFKALDVLLAHAEKSRTPALQPGQLPSQLVSAVNGAFGDYLLRNRNPLALRMGFYTHGQPLLIERSALAAQFPTASGKLVVFIHGLCCDETSWSFFSTGEHAHNRPYAEQLQQQGFSPLFVRYNTGIRIEQNGRMLAQLLTRLCEAWPQPIEQLVLIGHSMGGLVARSACSYGVMGKADWAGKISHVFCLGSPHLGAPLEKAAHLGVRVLQAFDVTEPLADLADERSTGIKDLRHGKSHHPKRPRPPHVPLRPPQAHFHFVGSVMSGHSTLGRLLGDGLVRMRSATADHLADDSTEIDGLNHIQLLNHPEVYAVIASTLDLPQTRQQEFTAG